MACCLTTFAAAQSLAQMHGCIAVAQLVYLGHHMQQTASALHHAAMIDLYLQMVMLHQAESSQLLHLLGFCNIFWWA